MDRSAGKKIENDTNLMTLLENKFPNHKLVIIISGKETEINRLKNFAPKLIEQLNYKSVFGLYTPEETAEIVRQILVKHQFVFDSTFLKEAVNDNYPSSTDERINQWPEEIVKSIIQVQSERLIDQPELSLEKEQIISLTQTDILKGIMAVK